MRKVLLTVMMVSSVLAFNACKKEGAQGPQGPAGPAGATGATGAAGAKGDVGPAGAKGADGTKILAGTVDPTAADGAVGDYFFNKTTKTLWGPKAAAGWAGTDLSLVGAKGDTGAKGDKGDTGAKGDKGTDGTRFLAGSVDPTAADGSVGDFYINTTTSTFFGPKQADGTWTTNSIPLGQAYAAKTYVITRGFGNVKEVVDGDGKAVRQYGQDLIETWSKYEIFSSYEVTANDMIRINQYPSWTENGVEVGGWKADREMIFQNDPIGNPGVFDRVPQSAADLGAAPFQVGAKFRYSRNKVNPTAEFTLTASDIARLTVDAGNAFGYLTYAAATKESVAQGKTLVLARNKNVQVKNSTTNFATQYTADTKFNLNTLVPNYEKYRQDGKIWVKYKYYTARTASAGNTLVAHTGPNAGWIDLTTYANSYLPGTGYGTAGVTDVNPFTLDAGASNFMTSAQPLGTLGTNVPFGPDQVAVAINTVARPAVNSKGNVVINWDITSGFGFGDPANNTQIGPTTLINPNNSLDPVTAAFGNVAHDITKPDFGDRSAPGFNTTWAYYTKPALTATNNAGANLAITGPNGGPSQTVPQLIRSNGKEADYVSSTNLVRIQVLALPGDVVKDLKAKGVNVDDINQVSKYVKL